MLKATYWFFQWLKWCSCWGGHYAGRADFGIDFNVSLTRITLYLPWTKSPKAKSNVCVCERAFERERVNKWICMSCWYYAERIWLATIANWQQIQWTSFQSRSSAIFVPTCFQLPNSTFLLQSHYCCCERWSNVWFFNNRTFMFCRCSCHSNVMTNQEDSSWDQSLIWVFHQFLLNITVCSWRGSYLSNL